MNTVSKEPKWESAGVLEKVKGATQGRWHRTKLERQARVKACKFLRQLFCILSAKRGHQQISVGKWHHAIYAMIIRAFHEIFIQSLTDEHLTDFQLLNRFLDLESTSSSITVYLWVWMVWRVRWCTDWWFYAWSNQGAEIFLAGVRSKLWLQCPERGKTAQSELPSGSHCSGRFCDYSWGIYLQFPKLCSQMYAPRLYIQVPR